MQTGSETHPISYSTNIGVPSWGGVKWMKSDNDHSLPSTAIPLLPLYAFMLYALNDLTPTWWIFIFYMVRYSKYSLLQKILRTSFVSCTALYVITLPVVRICCVPWQRSVIWPIQWFVQKMELGSLGTSTIVTGYMPNWLRFLAGNERTYHIASASVWQMVMWVQRACINWYIKNRRCRWCQAPSTRVAMFMQCCKTLYLQFVKRKL